MTNTTEQDEELQEQIESWRGPFEEFAAEVLGVSNVDLTQDNCQDEECTLGNFVTDAMLDYRKANNPDAHFAIINAGGIRAAIDKGNITRGEVLTAFPFGNAVVEITMPGEQIWKALEGIVTGVNPDNGEEVSSFFQISTGIKVQYNPENANNSKLVSVKINDEERQLLYAFQ
jgi:5'-nucleotidase